MPRIPSPNFTAVHREVIAARLYSVVEEALERFRAPEVLDGWGELHVRNNDQDHQPRFSPHFTVLDCDRFLAYWFTHCWCSADGGQPSQDHETDPALCCYRYSALLALDFVQSEMVTGTVPEAVAWANAYVALAIAGQILEYEQIPQRADLSLSEYHNDHFGVAETLAQYFLRLKRAMDEGEVLDDEGEIVQQAWDAWDIVINFLKTYWPYPEAPQ